LLRDLLGQIIIKKGREAADCGIRAKLCASHLKVDFSIHGSVGVPVYATAHPENFILLNKSRKILVTDPDLLRLREGEEPDLFEP
jgi:hypothetical protein